MKMNTKLVIAKIVNVITLIAAILTLAAAAILLVWGAWNETMCALFAFALPISITTAADLILVIFVVAIIVAIAKNIINEIDEGE